jgi:hypothetical protein
VRYAIADYLPLEAKQAAIKERYRTVDAKKLRRTYFGYGTCPLGVALRAMGDRLREPPGPSYVATFLVGRSDEHRRLEVANAAFEFTNDWDEGVITDLAAALFGDPS